MKKTKTKVGVASLVLLVTLLVDSCRTTAPESNSIVSPTQTPSNTIGLLTYQQALNQMYGKDIHTDQNNEISVLSADGIKFSIQIDLFSCYWDGSVETCIVVTERNQCSGCGAYVDGAIFNRVSESWKLRSFSSKITEIGSLGSTLETEVLQIGPTKYAVQLRWVYSSTGNTIEHLVIFAETENVFDVILNIGSRGEKWLSSDKMDYGWNTNLNFQKANQNSDYYNLIVTYYGDEKDMPYTEFYTFSNGKYNLVPKKSN